MRKLSLTILFLIIFFGNFLSTNAADYCSQPVPHDIANEGYNQKKESAPENPFGDPGSGKTSGEHDSLSGDILYVPPGASIPMYLERPLGSGFSHVGEIGYAYVVDSNGFGIPSGTLAELVVMMVEPGRRFSRAGRIQIGANRLILPNGNSVWLRGLVIDRKGESRIAGRRTGGFIRSAGKVALGSGIGALSGAAIGAVAGGSAGTGALIGTGIGVVVGGIWAAASKGEEVVLASGMPVLLNVSQGAQAYY